MKPHLKYLLPLLSVIFLGTVSFIFSAEATTIETSRTDFGDNLKLWSNTNKLTWEDFQGKKDKNNPHDAVTTSTLKTIPKVFRRDKVQYEIVALFDKKRSWTISDSEALLVHEQIHFDISELVLRKLRKKFLSHTLRSLDGVNKMIDSAFEEATKERNKLNKDYDKETDHSRNKRVQLVWQERIERELKTLKDYSSTLVTIMK